MVTGEVSNWKERAYYEYTGRNTSTISSQMEKLRFDHLILQEP